MYLVTGSTGFIGGALCRALVERGERVRAFHRHTSTLTLLEGLDPGRLEHAVGDVTDPASLRRAMGGVEAVFHTAAMLGSPQDPRQMYAVTVGGTRNLLQAAGEAGVRRVVHTSSVAALGVPQPRGVTAPLLLDETHTWNYRLEWWPYGHSKYLAELEVQQSVARGLDVVIANPAIVLGAGDIHQVSGGVLIHMARRGIPLSIEGGLNVVHIDDVVRGHLAALEYGQTGERYILAGENLTITAFLRLMAEVTGARPPRLELPGAPVRLLATPLGLLTHWLDLPVRDVLLRKAGYYFYYETGKAKRELRLGEMRSAREAVVDAYQWYKQRGEIL